MLRLLPLPIFICIYLFSWWRCKKNIIASDKQLKPCIDWAYVKNLPLPKNHLLSSFILFMFLLFLNSLWDNYSTTTFRKESKILRKRNEINI